VELTNRFRVAVPIEEAWALLTDVERIAPCLPGAQLTEIDGGDYRGLVKVKVGPITAQYKGTAHFVERDEAGGRAVLRAEGRETRGQGNAAATITAHLVPDGQGTEVSVVTDLIVTGKVAQFGRGVLADVSTKLLDQFSNSLAAELASSADTAPAHETSSTPASEASSGGRRRIDSPAAEPLDLLDTVSGPLVKRLVPVLAGVAVLWLLLRLFRRRSSGQ
jgi:carbon monoxide dehydrogenase subunit G